MSELGQAGWPAMLLRRPAVALAWSNALSGRSRAERRRVKLEEIQRQVKDGSLRIRKMSPEERRRYPAMPAKARRR